MRFIAAPGAEKGQIRLFAGEDALRDAVRRRLPPPQFRRLRRAIFERRGSSRSAWTRTCCARAREVFNEESQVVHPRPRRSQPRAWSLLPPFGDLLAELRTRPFDTLTYARRATRRRTSRCSIASGTQHRVYPSQDKLATRGALLQRRRPGRLRRARLRHRDATSARAPVDRRPHACSTEGAVVRPRHADAAARRTARRPVDRRRATDGCCSLRVQEPEQRAREPADAARARQRADAGD